MLLDFAHGWKIPSKNHQNSKLKLNWCVCELVGFLSWKCGGFSTAFQNIRVLTPKKVIDCICCVLVASMLAPWWIKVWKPHTYSKAATHTPKISRRKNVREPSNNSYMKNHMLMFINISNRWCSLDLKAHFLNIYRIKTTSPEVLCLRKYL